ncbi:MAG TPA: DoxX family protein [Gaiellaceae bacterium]|jgi:putative oxidoreductase|nr:DoxX family protein [Gaiellaceae bacterium]
MSYGILLLRVVFGLVIAAHGSQKLFGWFGGHGLRGTAGFFGQLGFRPPLAMAALAATAELAGGLLFALGLATPLAAFAIAVVMLNAIWAVHWKNGFWTANGGYEMNLFVLAAALAVVAAGPGRFSLDNWLGWAGDISGLWWAVGVLAAAVGAWLLTRVRRAEPAVELRRAA